MKRILALAICLGLMLTLMVGCGESQVEYYTDDELAANTGDADAAPDAADETVEGTGYATYAPDTVVGTVNGEEITWMEYYYWASYYAQYIQSLASAYGLTLTDWDALEMSSTNTNAEVALLNAQYASSQYHVMTQKAEEMGLTLDAEDEAAILGIFEDNADAAVGDGDGTCSEEEAAAFEDYLAQQNVDRDFFNYLSEVSLLNEKAFVQTYGQTGELVDDDAVAAYVDENGLMAAKHILLLTVDSATREALDEQTAAEKKALADELYGQLEAVAGDQDAMIALFNDLMDEYNEDTGYAAYPDGYIFSDGEMVESFENAVKALDVNYGLSGVVESEYGYHIILRIPVDPEGTVGTDSNGSNVTLRYSVANNLFSASMNEWMEAADIQWNEGFEDLDMLAVFGSLS